MILLQMFLFLFYTKHLNYAGGLEFIDKGGLKIEKENNRNLLFYAIDRKHYFTSSWDY